MRNWKWYQWVGFALVAAAVVALVVLHFVQPEVSYALTEAMTAGGVVVGFVGGFLLGRKKQPVTEA